MKLQPQKTGSSPLTTKGDLYTYATGNTRLGIGTDGYLLVARSSAAEGIVWEASTGVSGASNWTRSSGYITPNTTSDIIRGQEIQIGGKITGSSSLVLSTFTTAGVVKNTSTGLLSGGNTLTTSDVSTAFIVNTSNISQLNNDTGYSTHSAVTVTDTSSFDFTLTGQDITGNVKSSGVVHNDLNGILGSTSYYHLSSAVYAVLTTGISSSFATTGAYVPYSGATSNVVLGSYSLSGATGTFSSGLQANNIVITSGLTATTGNFSSSVDILGNLDVSSGITATTGNFTSGVSITGTLSVTASGQFSTAVEMNGNVNISKIDPEHRLTDTGNSEYTRITKSDTTNFAYRYNRVSQPGEIDSYTSLLLHCDGADGSTTFTDSSTNNHTITVVANTQIDTAQSKFGGASGYFDGTGDSLTLADHSSLQFGGGNFTIDFWVRWEGTPADDVFCGGNTGSGGIWFLDHTANTLRLRFTNADGSAYIGIFYCTPDFITNTWHHIEVARSGATCYMFIDGTSKGVTQDDPFDTLPNYAGGHYINNGTFPGWIDEFRISKGIARHTASFTPETGAYGASSTVETIIWQSEDGTGSGEKGIQTWGDTNGRTNIRGRTVRFFSSSTEAMRIDSTGYIGINTTTPHSHSHIAGSFARQTDVYSSAVTIGSTNSTILASTGITITLPASSSIAGREYLIKNISTASVTINVNSTTNVIDGSTSASLATQYEKVLLVAGNNNWNIISS